MARNNEVYASYKPLYETLKKKNLTIYDLVKHDVLTETVITRMNCGFDLPFLNYVIIQNVQKKRLQNIFQFLKNNNDQVMPLRKDIMEWNTLAEIRKV